MYIAFEWFCQELLDIWNEWIRSFSDMFEDSQCQYILQYSALGKVA